MLEPSTVGLPFAHLNLRFNPFGELDSQSRSVLAVVDVDDLVSRLEKPGFAVQFIGEKGRGKTTHMLAILSRFPTAAYVHVGEGESPRIGPSDPLFVDEIQRVSPRRRQRLFRRGVSLVIGTHEDVSTELIRAGLEVETIEVAQRLNPNALREILNRRIEWARRTEGRIPCVRLETARLMMDRFGDDVRAIEGHLYEVIQELETIEDV